MEVDKEKIEAMDAASVQTVRGNAKTVKIQKTRGRGLSL